MSIQRKLGPLLAVTLIIGITAAIYISANRKAIEDKTLADAAAIIAVKGMIGSEKESFFTDPKVIALLAKHGMRASVEKVGSRDIANRDLAGYDFGFPSGAPAAINLQHKANAKQSYPIFFTPMAVASWQTLVPVLEQENLIKKINDTYYIIDMKRLLSLIDNGVRWRDLKNNTAFATGKSILISSTDVRKSNSAAMYLSLASYVANDNNVVENLEQANRILPLMSSLFLRQGLQEESSAGPFEDYITMGIGKAPLVMIYESQFLEYQARRAELNPEMILFYPQPTLYSKHILVPFTENGRKLGELLANDPELQQVASTYGYRSANPALFTAFLAEHKLTAPQTIVDVIDPPSHEVLERMILDIEKKFQ